MRKIVSSGSSVGKIDDVILFSIKIKLPSGDIVTYPNNVAIQKPIVEIRKNNIRVGKAK